MSNKLQSNQDKNHLYLLFETEGILQVDLVVNFISVGGGSPISVMVVLVLVGTCTDGGGNQMVDGRGPCLLLFAFALHLQCL